MNKSALQEAIRAEFEDVPYPGDNHIGDPNGRDDAESVTEWLRGMDWRALESKERLSYLALYYMTPQACHHYVAAYLLGTLERKDGAMEGIHLCLHPRCIDARYPIASERFLTIVSLFSPAQRRLVAEVLAYGLKATREWIAEIFDQQPDLDEDESAEEVGEEEIERRRIRRRANWDVYLEEERERYEPIIEYWRPMGAAGEGARES